MISLETFLLDLICMKAIPFLVLTLFLVGCFGAKVASEPKVEEALNLDKAIAKFPGYTSEEYHSGKKLYEAKCNTCHALKDPTKFNEEGLMKTVPKMVQMANESKEAALSRDDQQSILRYMVAAGL